MNEMRERRLLYALGIKLRTHHVDPALGWIATTRYGQVGPLLSKQDVIDRALLLIHDADRDRNERAEQRVVHHRIANVLSALGPLLNALG